MTWDITLPAGTEAVSNGDNRIRELKTDLQTALRGNTTDGLEAKFPGSDTANPVFRYRGLKGATSARPVSGQYGLYIDTDRNAVQRDNGSSWEDVATLIPAATVMLFFQAAAPVGWTKLTTQNDRALRIVSGAGGGTGGTNLVSVGMAHTHTVASHTHDLGSHTHTTPNHTHELDRTAYVDRIGFQTVEPTSGLPSLLISDTLLGEHVLYAGVITAPGTGPGFTAYSYSNLTSSGGSGTSGAASGNTGAATPATDSQAPVIAYADVIQCSKD